MGKVNTIKIAKTPITFKVWCVENRWTTTKLAKEFGKYGVKISATTIWYWQRGQYSPSYMKPEYYKVLSEICGFDAREFSNFQGSEGNNLEEESRGIQG